MSTVSLPLSAEVSGRMRPINILRDLPKIADLVEICFQKNMDGEGRRYIQQMRDASHDRSYLQRVNSSLPLAGYIWEDGHEIVGNISVVPFRKGNFLLANIAVHPDYRRHGIAHQLTQHAMKQVRGRGAQSIWLHVEDDNDVAIHLYESLGFRGKTLRTTWNASMGFQPQHQPKTPHITTKIARFWEEHRRWLDQNYPEDLHWYRMPDFQIFTPGLKYWLYRIFVENGVRQWAIQKNGELQAVVSWVPKHTRRSPLWLATTPRADARSLTELLLHVRTQLLPQHVELYIDYPADQHEGAFTEAGFTAQRNLLWMRASGN